MNENASLLHHFHEKDCREISKILEQGGQDERIIFLQNSINNKEIDIFSLIEKGLFSLPEITEFEQNNNLSSYFFILSQLKELDTNLRDFCIELMLYCEGDEFSEYSTQKAEQIREKYREIKNTAK